MFQRFFLLLLHLSAVNMSNDMTTRTLVVIFCPLVMHVDFELSAFEFCEGTLILRVDHVDLIAF